jgi:phosphopantothenoylcysteine synthetase/decarboxylase
VTNVRRICLHQSRKGKDIILHAGGRRGFIPNVMFIFKSNQKTGDYHNEMNGENYICWLKKNLIPNMEPNSVLMTDSAPL